MVFELRKLFAIWSHPVALTHRVDPGAKVPSGTLALLPVVRESLPMSSLYVILLVVIAVTLMGVSLFRASLVKTKADYLVAGRSLPAIVLVFTLLSSWIGAGSLFAGAENAYKNGFAALWQPAGGWLGLLLIYFIAPRAR